MEYALLGARMGLGTAITLCNKRARSLKSSGQTKRSEKWSKAAKAVATAQAALEEVLEDLELDD